MNDSIVALFSLASVAALVVFLFWAYRDYCVDSLRQKMFALRDKFFDEAVEGRLSFESSAYGMIRTTMNGFICFGHRLTLPHFIAITLTLGRYTEGAQHVPFAERLEKNLEQLDKEQKEIVLEYRRQMNLILVRHLLLSSPLLLVTVLIPSAVMIDLVARAAEALKRQLDQLDTFALAEGETTIT